MMPNGLELSCPAEAGGSSPLYARLAGQASSNRAPARRVSFSELLGRPGGHSIELTTDALNERYDLGCVVEFLECDGTSRGA